MPGVCPHSILYCIYDTIKCSAYIELMIQSSACCADTLWTESACGAQSESLSALKQEICNTVLAHCRDRMRWRCAFGTPLIVPLAQEWKVAINMGGGPFWPRWAMLVAQCDAQ
eukprot:4554067-Ditylum_brightwellii.AAC.1